MNPAEILTMAAWAHANGEITTEVYRRCGALVTLAMENVWQPTEQMILDRIAEMDAVGKIAPEQFQTIACPTCKAAPGEPCDSPRKHGYPHVSRQDRAVRKSNGQ